MGWVSTGKGRGTSGFSSLPLQPQFLSLHKLIFIWFLTTKMENCACGHRTLIDCQGHFGWQSYINTSWPLPLLLHLRQEKAGVYPRLGFRSCSWRKTWDGMAWGVESWEISFQKRDMLLNILKLLVNCSYKQVQVQRCIFTQSHKQTSVESKNHWVRGSSEFSQRILDNGHSLAAVAW